tara:strand:+ start:115 stop:648 length:534 start_codon:yes stop_codon:yes gene_type:complete
MKITKDSIVSSVCGIDSNITLQDLSKQLDLGKGWFSVNDFFNPNFEDLYQYNIDSIEGESYLTEENGKLMFSWKGQEDFGITQVLKNIFGEEYLLRVDLDVVYEDTGESYIEIMIFDNKKEILENVVRYDGKELTPEEKSVHDNRDQDYFYLNSYEVSFLKKSEFNKDNVEGQPIVL